MKTKSTPEQRRTYYRNWAAKPGNLEQKRAANRDAYHERKLLRICPIVGCDQDPAPGKTLCERHALIRNRGRRPDSSVGTNEDF